MDCEEPRPDAGRASVVAELYVLPDPRSPIWEPGGDLMLDIDCRGSVDVCVPYKSMAEDLGKKVALISRARYLQVVYYGPYRVNE